MAGSMLVLLDMNTKQQRYIPSSSGEGIGAIMPHPSRKYFAVAEKGSQPEIIIYEYSSLEPYRALKGGTIKAYSCINFNRDGTLLASVGAGPDYMLTVWDWIREHVVLRFKAFSQDVYRVTFSPDDPGQLTTSGSGHIKFWKMADTFTCLKLQGMLGRFGKTPLTDIEGYVEFPDGKVLSGTEWGNMLIWDGGLIKVEIGRKNGRPCHAGCVKQITLTSEEELITVGADGAVRCWDFESVDAADCMDDSGLFELEPINELIIGRNVSLSSMVRSPAAPDSTVWFAQDSNGGIWKLDLSFSNTTPPPECLFSFHAGAIEGMDVSGLSHLMATTGLDGSVRVFDFLSNKEIAVSRYRQGGSSLTWCPRTVSDSEGLLVVGFEDGVVRLLELCPQRTQLVARSTLSKLHLKQAFKPHDASVTAISYKPNGQILATGSVDGRVFFFSVGESYEPIGFVRVPAAVRSLQWAPQSQERNALLVACQTGVVEVEAPDSRGAAVGNTFHLQNIPIRHFFFQSIKSRLQRDAEIARRQALKEQQEAERQNQEETNHGQIYAVEEEEEELPPIFIPSPPSPLHCAFYSTEPGAFWLSVGGYDSGYLYHCKFSEQESADASERTDEPFAYVPVQDADHNPIFTVCFCEARQTLLCGMQDGSIRVYPLESGALQPEDMKVYQVLSVFDSQHGTVRQLRVSHDSRFVLCTAADGNIFSFRLLEKDMTEALQKEDAKVPSPRLGLDTVSVPMDIDDPAAYSIETAKQKSEVDRLQWEAKLRKQERRNKLIKLRRRFNALLQENLTLPERIRLPRSELEFDRRFHEEVTRSTAEKVEKVKRELAWETEKNRIGLQKLHDRFLGSVICDTLTVSAIKSDHKVSTYKLVALASKRHEPKEQVRVEQRFDHASQDRSSAKEQKDTLTDSISVLKRSVPQGTAGKLAARQAEKLRKAAEKAEQARMKIEQSKKEWKEFYASKPSKDYEDPEEVRAIQLAKENMGDFKLKSAKDYTVPEHLRMNVEKKMAQVVELEEQIHQRKNQMNMRVLALRDSKVALISQFSSYMDQLLAIQKHLPAEKHRVPPTPPTLTREETPEKELEYSNATLERYTAAQATTGHGSDADKLKEPQEETKQDAGKDAGHAEEAHQPLSENLTELEQEVMEVEEIRNLYLQDKLIKQMEEAVYVFDAKLRLVRHDKITLDVKMKLADLRHNTLSQELLLLEEFEKRELTLQERLNVCVKEERELMSKLEECKDQVEMKKRDIAILNEREKVLAFTFEASLGENNKFEEFLTRVFKKKIKRAKKKEKLHTAEEEEESEVESEVLSDWDSDEDYEGSDEAAACDLSVCPPSCDPELFDSTVRLREQRLDLEERLQEEKLEVDSLKKELDALTKKEKIAQCNLKAAEGDLELLNREKQQKLNELDVVVPLRLHQIECLKNQDMYSDLSSALVINNATVKRLHEQIQRLQQENCTQKQLYKEARQQHVQLRSELKNMMEKSQELKAKCEQLMLDRFGKLVDLEALQTLSGNRKLEELKYEKHVQEAQHWHEHRMWQAKVDAADKELANACKENTERLRQLKALMSEKKLLEDKLDDLQRKTICPFQESQQAEQEDIRKLQLRVQSQAEKIKSLKEEISKLSRKDGNIQPPSR
ncbi:cilia- and flagella-associated protein 44 [Clarias magur]|uniref:Cilia- and flagella-associated protein 44 n=1 Tax=Clarias magur TaxID=1594786 RepID=A0A8J4TFE1_CLAMG|nr:cilia- and flagella-associated protein 44 [Clarias magur]